MVRRLCGLVLLLTLALVGSAGTVAAEEEAGRAWHTLLDNAGRVLLRTGHVLSPGDLFIDAANREYVVVRTDGPFAYAAKASKTAMASLAGAGVAAEPPSSRRIGIYHSHTDESYVPTDGKSSIRGQGGILDVGEELARELEDRGYEVDHSREPHDPHDAGAYDRSRRTAAGMIDEGPAALVDVHRDTGPPEGYQVEINGQTVTQVLLVVGRQNPNVAANAEYARDIKRVADEKYPGLVRGILFARGKYNQDLHPRAVLVEAGSHLNDKDEAKRSMSLLADVIPLTLDKRAAAGVGTGAGRAGIITAASLVAITALFAGTYLVVATGSVAEAKRTLQRFVRRDIGLGGKNRDEGEGEQG